MKQHSIPQDITGYKFHLIGAMTLKQFAELAAGAIMAFIVYRSNLIGVVKWPIFIFVIILAIMIAFVPIEERPLDFWIITYFKNLWKPTKFFWKKTPKIPHFFNYKPGQNQNLDVTPEVNYSPARKARIQEYLQSIPNTDEKLDEWDINYHQRANNLLANFDQVSIKAENISIQRAVKTNKPQLKTRIRKLKSLEDIQNQQTQKAEPEPPVEETNNLRLSNNVKKETNQAQNTENSTAQLKEEKNNQLRGIIKNSSGEVVSNALIEVFAKNEEQALRISKSNANGEFFIKTALPNGEYQIKTEAEALTFMPIAIRLTGRRVPAIEIVAEQDRGSFINR
jgi:hypothetical protein